LENKDIFDLEQNINMCWFVTDDIAMLAEACNEMDKDDVVKCLVGLKSIYDLKFEHLRRNYDTVFEEFMSYKHGDKK
jgi:hypothetical protein